MGDTDDNTVSTYVQYVSINVGNIHRPVRSTPFGDCVCTVRRVTELVAVNWMLQLSVPNRNFGVIPWLEDRRAPSDTQVGRTSYRTLLLGSSHTLGSSADSGLISKEAC